MEFSADIAILQSALQLIDKRSSLEPATKSDVKSSVEIVSAAVKEVCCGIGHVLSETDHSLTKLKVTTVLIYKVLLENPTLTRNADEDSKTEILIRTWDTMLYGIPELSWQFVFDVIHSSHLWPEVFKLLPHLPLSTAAKLLCELLCYLSAGDSSHLEQLVFVIVYVSLHWKSPVFCHQMVPQSDIQQDSTRQNRKQAVLMKVIGCGKLTEDLIWKSLPPSHDVTEEEVHDLVSAVFSSAEVFFKSDTVDKTRQATCYLSVLNLAVSLLCGNGWLLSPVSDQLDKNDTPLSTEDQSPMKALKDILTKCDGSREDEIQVLVSEIKASDLPLKLEKTRICAKDCLLKCERFIKRCSVDCSEMFVEEIKHFDIGSLLHVKHQQLYRHLWEKVSRQMILNQHLLLEDVIQDSWVESHSSVITEIQNLLKVQVKLIQDLHEKEVAILDKTDDKLVKASVILKLSLPGKHDHLISLLSLKDVAIVTDQRWLQGIEYGKSLVGDPAIIPTAVRQLSWLKENNLPKSHVCQLQKIIVESVHELDTQTQNRALHELASLYTSMELEALFDVDKSTKSQLRIVLNRLTEEVLTESISKISSLCIQCPLVVIHAIVHCAAQSRGQIDVLVQVLQHLPAMLKFQVDDDNLLMRTLADLLEKDETLSTQVTKNISLLCKQLLLPYKIAGVAECQSPVLILGKFLHDFILPHLLPSNNSKHRKNAKSLCLQLLHASLDSMPKLLPDWMDLVLETQPFTLLDIILSKVDSLLTSRDHDLETGSDLDIAEGHYVRMDSFSRPKWLDCLLMLLEILEKNRELVSDIDLLWLSTRLDRFHWTTKCYCYTIYKESDIQLSLEIPYRVLELASLPFTSSTSPDDGFLGLFQFVAISDVTLTLAQSCLKSGMDCPVRLTLSKITLAMAVMLPHYTGVEVSRLVTFLHHLIEENVDLKHVIAGDNKISTGVCCWLVIKFVLQLIICDASSNHGSLNWTKLAVTVMFAIKTKLLAVISGPNALTDLCHCLIVLCNILSDWPDTESAQHLLTLGLDLIGRLDVQLGHYRKLHENKPEKVTSEIKDVLSLLKCECSQVSVVDLQEPLEKVLQAVNV